MSSALFVSLPQSWGFEVLNSSSRSRPLSLTACDLLLLLPALDHSPLLRHFQKLAERHRKSTAPIPSMASTTTTSLKLLGGLAMIASASSTLTMSKVGGYASVIDGPLEIVVVKPSTNVSYFGPVQTFGLALFVVCNFAPAVFSLQMYSRYQRIKFRL